MTQTNRRMDAVFEGGGVAGIGLVGALSVIEAAGYEIVNLAGTSSGAIVAALVASGYTAEQLKRIINDLPFNSFKDPPPIGRIPWLGDLIDEVFQNGLYNGDVFLNLMRQLLADKGVHTFRDLIMPEFANDDRYRFKLRVVASDITRRRMLVLPQDIRDYDLVPEDLEVALALRMSMSIPFFFIPVKLKGSDIIDGGVLSNFPVEIFDLNGPPPWPTFGFKLVRSDDADPSTLVQQPIQGPLAELAAIYFTAQEAHDAYYLRNDKFVRTITIDTLGINATAFDLTDLQKEKLYESGVQGAQIFLRHWNFERYKKLFRSGKPVPTRREQVWR